MKRKYRIRILAAALGQAVVLGGCSLLPAEDAVRQTVLVITEDSLDYELAQVVRTDIALTQPVYCTYTQLKEENLSFSVDSRPVQYVYVSAGDNVKAGDLLAKLNIDDIEANLSELEYSIEKNNLLLRQTLEWKSLDLEDAKEAYQEGYLSKKEYEAKTAQIEENYRSMIQGYEDVLYIAELRVEKLRAEKEGSLLYAGMDGTVSYVRSSLQGSRPPAGTTAITIIDSSQCAFRSDKMDYAEYFTPGDTVILRNSNGTEYETVVMSSEESPDKEHIYFSLKELDFELSVGTRATATLTLDFRQSVLALPKAAIHRAEEKYYVYREDESGLKTMQYITAGMFGDNMVEITGGLSEGDIVIKR